MVPPDVTINEMWRRMNRFDVDTRERLMGIHNRIDSLSRETVPINVYEERHGNLRARVSVLEETAERAAQYRRNLTIAIIASVVGSLGAVTASLLAVLVH